jgi:LPS export ABC transporter protein LptC
MKRSRFFWILSALLVTVFIIIFSYEKQSVKINPSFKTSTMQNLQLTHNENNKVEWKLLARKATFPMDKKEILLESIDMTINNSPQIFVTSGNGTYEIENENITLGRSVEMKTENAKFITDTLKWYSKDELVITEDAVKFFGKQFLIEGTGLKAKIDQQKVRILKDVKATFYH